MFPTHFACNLLHMILLPFLWKQRDLGRFRRFGTVYETDCNSPCPILSHVSHSVTKIKPIKMKEAAIRSGVLLFLSFNPLSSRCFISTLPPTRRYQAPCAARESNSRRNIGTLGQYLQILMCWHRNGHRNLKKKDLSNVGGERSESREPEAQ